MEEIKEQPALLENKKHRFWELDFLRGICVLLMVFDHFMSTIGFVMPAVGSSMGKNIWAGAETFVTDVYWYGGLRTYAHVIVVCIFFLLCGISCTFSRSNYKRGFMCFLFGCGVTFVTVVTDLIADLGISIYFGVLHMLGIAMLLYGLFDTLGSLIAKIGKTEESKAVTKIIGEYLAPTIGLILLIIFFACFQGKDCALFETDIVIEDKASSVLASLFVNVKCFQNNAAWSVGGMDYWPLLPWVAIVLIGGFIGRGLYHSKAKNYLSKFDGKWNKPVCFVGRHALVIYVAHQVVIFALCYLITLIA
ncbi:MAG: DUF1624 domain-containing protein [Clostridiales bacterium]|nr:DUF1624 domain-containing protein [Clostridiales bacterium]